MWDGEWGLREGIRWEDFELGFDHEQHGFVVSFGPSFFHHGMHWLGIWGLLPCFVIWDSHLGFGLCRRMYSQSIASLTPSLVLTIGMIGMYPVNALIGRTLLSRALRASAILVKPACWISSTFKELGKSCLLASIRTGISAVSWCEIIDSTRKVRLWHAHQENWDGRHTQGILTLFNPSSIGCIDNKYQCITLLIIFLPNLP